jgi:transcriptional regulator with XRE-family HTH domain
MSSRQAPVFVTTQDDLARLARNLKTARLARGITQPQAAAAVGVKSRQTIVNWESPENEAEPSTKQLAVLAELYGVTPKDLRFAEELERQPARAKEMPLDSFVPQSSAPAKKRGSA